MKHIILLILFTMGILADGNLFSKKMTIPYVVDDYVTIATIGDKHIAVYKNSFNSLSIIDIMTQKEIAKIEHPFKNEKVEHIQDVNDTKEKRFDFIKSDREVFDGVLIDPKSKMLFIFSTDVNGNLVKAFDVLSGKEVWARSADAPIQKMAVYKNMLIIADSKPSINLWDIHKPRQIRLDEGINNWFKSVKEFFLFEKEDLLVVNSFHNEIGKIYNLKSNRELQGSNFDDIFRRGHFDFAYFNDMLYLTGPLTTVYAGSIRGNTPAVEIGKFDKWGASRVDTTPNGGYIVSRNADTIKVLESKTYQEVYSYTKEPFNRDGDHRIGTFVDYQIVNDNELLIGTCKEGLLFKYNLVTKTTEQFTAKEKRCIQQFALDPNSKYIFTIDVEGGITTWDLATKQEVANYKHKKN